MTEVKPISSSEISADTATALLALLLRLKQENYAFTTVTPDTHFSINQRPENALAQSLRDILGWSRPFTQATAGPWFALLEQAQALQEVLDGDLRNASSAKLQGNTPLWRSLWRVSSLGEMLLLHSAFPTLAADAIFFGPDTYRFARAISQYLDLHQPKVQRAVDIGTGSGAAAILLALRYPAAEVIGLDINPRSLSVAAINARAHGAANVRWQTSNLLQDVSGKFDLIVANPPYLVDEGQRTYRHGGELLGAELSLKILQEALPRLEAGGRLLLYTGVAIVDGQDVFLQAAQPLLAQHAEEFSYEYSEIDPDIFAEELQRPAYAQVERLAAVLLSVRRG